MHEHRFCKVLKHASFPFKSTEGSARPRYTSRDPESAESPSEGPAGSKCAGGGSARPGCPSAEPVRAKCPSELRPARLAIGLVLVGGNRELAFGSSPAAEPEKGVGRGWARPTSAASSIIVLSPPHPRQFFWQFFQQLCDVAARRAAEARHIDLFGWALSDTGRSAERSTGSSTTPSTFATAKHIRPRCIDM